MLSSALCSLEAFSYLTNYKEGKRKESMASTFYEVLGISKLATDAEIKRAFKELAKKYHPDKHPGQVFYEEHFKKINAAYQTLSDPKTRKVYDLRLFYAHNTTAQQSPPQQNRSNPTQHKSYTNTSGQGPARPQYKKPPSSAQPRSATDQKKLKRYYMFIGIAVCVICIFSYWFYNFMNRYTSEMYFTEGLKEEINHNDREALDFYVASLTYNENNAAANEKAGDMQIRLSKEYNTALSLYARALKNYEGAKDLRRVGLKRAKIHIQLAQYPAAVSELEIVQQLSDEKQDDSVEYYVANIYFNQSSYVKARELYSDYFKKHPTSSESLISVAVCHLNEGNTDYALGNLNDAIYTFPSRGEAYYYKGLVRMIEKDTAAACKLFRKADSLDFKTGKDAMYTYCK